MPWADGSAGYLCTAQGDRACGGDSQWLVLAASVSTANQLLSLPTTPAAPTLTGPAEQEVRSKAGLVRTLLS